MLHFDISENEIEFFLFCFLIQFFLLLLDYSALFQHATMSYYLVLNMLLQVNSIELKILILFFLAFQLALLNGQSSWQYFISPVRFYMLVNSNEKYFCIRFQTNLFDFSSYSRTIGTRLFRYLVSKSSDISCFCRGCGVCPFLRHMCSFTSSGKNWRLPNKYDTINECCFQFTVTMNKSG